MISYFYKLRNNITFYLSRLSHVKIVREKRQSFPASNKKSTKSHRVSLYIVRWTILYEMTFYIRAAHLGSHQRLPGSVVNPERFIPDPSLSF